MDATTEKKKALVTPRARLSYPQLFRARAFEGNEPKFGCTLIFGEAAQKTPEYAALKKAAAAVAKDKWGDKIPATLRSPFRDAGDKGGDGYEAGKIFINTTTKQKPGVVNQRKEDVEDETELYAGCFVRASVRPYAYSQKGNSGVAFGLMNIQKLADGDSLGSRTRVTDDFDVVDADETTSEESADALF